MRLRIIAVISVFVLLCLYMWTYSILMYTDEIAIIDGGSGWKGPMDQYRCRYGHIVFWPANQLDRQVRPSFWAGQRFSVRKTNKVSNSEED
jgi:hypothetical protein